MALIIPFLSVFMFLLTSHSIKTRDLFYAGKTKTGPKNCDEYFK